MITTLQAFKESKKQPKDPNLSKDILMVQQDTLEPLDTDEWDIDQVVGIFTDAEKIKKIEENSNNVSIDLSVKNIKINDKIYVSCLLKPRNKSTAYPMGEMGVICARVTDIFYGLNKINQLSKAGKLLK